SSVRWTLLISILFFDTARALQCHDIFDLFFSADEFNSKPSKEELRRLHKMPSLGERYRQWLRRGYDPIQCPMPEKLDDLHAIREKLLTIRDNHAFDGLPSVENDRTLSARYGILKRQALGHIDETLRLISNILAQSPPNL